jgi:hypothetical protein
VRPGRAWRALGRSRPPGTIIRDKKGEPGGDTIQEVIVEETEQGRGILGVVEGSSPTGIENEGEIEWRRDLLRRIGDKR